MLSRDKELFILASDDFASCEALINVNVIKHVVFFLAQQTVEKSMKAVMEKNNIKYPFIHDLLELDKLLKNHNIEIPLSELWLETINTFSVESRYFLPDEEFPDAKEILNITRSALDWCKEQIYDR